MRVLTRGTAVAFATVVSFGTNAADLSYPGRPAPIRNGCAAGRCTTPSHHRSRPSGSPAVSRRTNSAAAGWRLPVWHSSDNPSKG